MAHLCRVVLLCVLSLDTLAWGQLANHIVISECAPGGGSSNAGALYQRDWVELYNPTNSAVNVAGWTLQYKSAAGSGNYSVGVTFGAVSMAPHSYYLVVGGPAGTGGQVLSPIADADAGSGLTMSATEGRLALCSNGTALISGSESSAANIVDFIGWGTGAAYFEGGSSAPTPSISLTLERKARFASTAVSMASSGADAANGNSYDSNNNGFDFVAQASSAPQNSTASPLELPSSSETHALSGSIGPNYYIVGDGTNSYGVNINLTAAAAPGSTTVTINSGAAAAHSNELAGKKVIDKYYSISSSVTGAIYTLELEYLQSQYNDLKSPVLTEPGMFLVARTSINTFQTFTRGAGSVLSSAANGKVQATGAAVFGDWFISADNTSPLPVEITKFSAGMRGTSAFLAWTTATEINNLGFTIERKVQGTSAWMRIGFVEGAGSCDRPNEYAFTDRNIPPGMVIYRLKQIDHNGAFTYSGEQHIDAGASPKIFQILNNYPNPFNPSTVIRFSVPGDGFTTLDVCNSLGQRVRLLFSGMAQADHEMTTVFNATGLASGVYYARLQFGGRCVMQKMVFAK